MSDTITNTVRNCARCAICDAQEADAEEGEWLSLAVCEEPTNLTEDPPVRFVKDLCPRCVRRVRGSA